MARRFTHQHPERRGLYHAGGRYDQDIVAGQFDTRIPVFPSTVDQNFLGTIDKISIFAASL
jgi:hypothetical protein